jgi:hypothetical protein
VLRRKINSDIRQDLKIWDFENPLFDHELIVRTVCGFVVSGFAVVVYDSLGFAGSECRRQRY